MPGPDKAVEREAAEEFERQIAADGIRTEPFGDFPVIYTHEFRWPDGRVDVLRRSHVDGTPFRRLFDGVAEAPA